MIMAYSNRMKSAITSPTMKTWKSICGIRPGGPALTPKYRDLVCFPRRELRSEQGRFTITVENLPPGKADRVDFDLSSGEAIVSES